MIPQATLGQVTTRDGRELILYERAGAFYIRLDGLELMSSLAHGSEDALAELALDAVRHVEAPSVLIGGLGMGFTLRATLDRFPTASRLVVAEVFPEVIAWNRGPLAHLARRPLDDPRVELINRDVYEVLPRGGFDVILLDVDNGPAPFTLESNARLYDRAGIGRLRAALNPGGVLSLWSAGEEPAFERQLRKVGLEVRRQTVHARRQGGGPRHAIYLVREKSNDGHGQRSPGSRQRSPGPRQRPRKRRR